VLTPRHLSDADLVALDDLERRVVAVDGGRLKLEKAVLREGRAQGLLAHDGVRLVGFLGVYRFGEATELAGAVDPAARRRGLGGALLDAALACASGATVLLVVPSGSEAGQALARSRGGTPHHAEHALVLTVPPPHEPHDPRTTVRPAGPGDVEWTSRLLQSAFGHVVDGLEPDSLVVAHDGVRVGTLRATRDGDTTGVYGFAVDPDRRGEGIGGDVLRRVCRQALAAGAARVALEVAVDNPHALRLYTSCGFLPVAGEDYWSLPVPVPVGAAGHPPG
jgi:ribosomal protein S18 acetylase RimI-like enzyme